MPNDDPMLEHTMDKYDSSLNFILGFANYSEAFDPLDNRFFEFVGYELTLIEDESIGSTFEENSKWNRRADDPEPEGPEEPSDVFYNL